MAGKITWRWKDPKNLEVSRRRSESGGKPCCTGTEHSTIAQPVIEKLCPEVQLAGVRLHEPGVQLVNQVWDDQDRNGNPAQIHGGSARGELHLLRHLWETRDPEYMGSVPAQSLHTDVREINTMVHNSLEYDLRTSYN